MSANSPRGREAAAGCSVTREYTGCGATCPPFEGNWLFNEIETAFPNWEGLPRVQCKCIDKADSYFSQVVVQFDKEASQTRDYCVAKNATRRAARPDPSLRKGRLFRMTAKLHHYLSYAALFVETRKE